MSVRKRGPYWPDRVVEFARDLLVAGWRPKEIHNVLRTQFSKSETPPLSTVQRWCRDWRFEDQSGDWKLMTEEPAAAELVLDTLKALIMESKGRVSSVSKAEAKNVNWLRQVRGDLGTIETWYLSRYYLFRAAHDEPTDDLDLFITFAPWRDDNGWNKYQHAARNARVPVAPMALQLMTRSRDVGSGENGEPEPRSPVWIVREYAKFRRRSGSSGTDSASEVENR